MPNVFEAVRTRECPTHSPVALLIGGLRLLSVAVVWGGLDIPIRLSRYETLISPSLNAYVHISLTFSLCHRLASVQHMIPKPSSNPALALVAT